MAKGEEEKKEEEAPKGGKKKIIIIAAVVVVVLILGGVGAFFAMSGKAKSAAGDEETAEEDTEAEEDTGEEGEAGELPGKVVPLESFIVNLQVKGSFLKATVQLEFGEPEPPATFNNDMPKVRHAIISVLSSKSAGDILTNDGKDKLRSEIKDAVNQVLGSEDVVQVYFSDFIIQ